MTVTDTSAPPTAASPDAAPQAAGTRDAVVPPPGLVWEEHTSLLGNTATAVFDDTGTYRYLLTRIWDRDLPLACWIMLNPSTATATRKDPTLGRVVDFTARFGCGGLAIVNLFALRATDPRQLADHPDPVGPHNDAFVRNTVRETRGGPVIAAWGAAGTLHDRAQAVTKRLRAGRVDVKCLGVTGPGSGHQPRHPLYLLGDTALQPYLENDPT